MRATGLLPHVERLGDSIAQAQISWLLVAVTLHLGGQLARGMAWHGVLRASWPDCSRRRACAWHICGAGLTGVLPVRGGDAVRIGLARHELPGASWTVLAGTLVGEGSFELLSGLVLVLVTVALGVGAITVPSPLMAGAVAFALLGLVALARRSPRARRLLNDLCRGAASLRDPAHVIRWVLPWQFGGRALRMGSTRCFLRAAGLPSTFATVVAACAARGSSNAVPLPGVSTATTAAALLVALPLAAGHPLDVEAVTALAVVQTVVLAAIGAIVSTALLCLLLGARTLPGMVQAFRTLRQSPIPVPAG